LNDKHIQRISQELALSNKHVKAVASLIGEGATVPFISRYRKEATGSMDEVAVGKIRDRLTELAELDKRRDSILSSLAERDILTDELKIAIENAKDRTILEDIYLPHRPKRQTRASIAKERGLAPLAELIFKQEGISPELEAKGFVDADKDVPDIETALSYWKEALTWWAKLHTIDYVHLDEVEEWEDEVYRIDQGELDYGEFIALDLARLQKVRDAFEKMDQSTY